MDKLFVEKMNLFELKKESIECAEITFDEFIGQGVIRSQCQFDDPVWYTTDEYENIGIHFTFNEDTYDEYYRDYFKMELDEFIHYLKAYLMTIFGKNALNSIRSFILDIRHIVDRDIDEVSNATKYLYVTAPALVADFLSLLPEPFEDYKELGRAMDAYSANNFIDKERNQRALADFDTYFLFDSILNDYWKAELPDSDRLFFYPIYLWWNVTAIIPQRPREFILTERNCISQNMDGSYSLRLRENRIKGSDRQVSYRIEDDYVTKTFRVPAKIGKEFERYIEMTEEFEPNELGTLFVTEPHYKKWGQKKHQDSRFFTYNNLRTVLRVFYKEVLQGIYGLTVYYRYEPKHLAQGDICYIQLGDTRHIAMINAMQQGGTPAVVMFLAGHDNENTSSHYYSNITALAQCKTYTRHKLLMGKSDTEFQLIPPTYYPDRSEGYVLTDGGKCFSDKFINGDISDCMKVAGPNGEIGLCTSCPFYRPKGLSYFTSDDIYKRNIMDDCKELERAVSIVRQEKGGVEEIGQAVLRLSVSSLNYTQFLEERNAHGQKETN